VIEVGTRLRKMKKSTKICEFIPVVGSTGIKKIALSRSLDSVSVHELIYKIFFN